MKTPTNKVVRNLCTAAVALGLSAGVMANTVIQQDEPRQPPFKAQQVYKFTYNPESFEGSLAHDVQLAQAEIMADLKLSRDADIATALNRSGAELRGYALIASAEKKESTSWAVKSITTLLPSIKARAYL